MRRAVSWLLLLAPLLVTAPAAHAAGSCDEWVHRTVRATGAYLPAAEAYARSFVFALKLNCNGTEELVTVQRPTGHLPVCAKDQQVEVVGRLVWNRSFVGGHYEINDPSSAVCR